MGDNAGATAIAPAALGANDAHNLAIELENLSYFVQD